MVKTSVNVQMQQEWDERAHQDAFHYIHPRFSQGADEVEFFGSGEWLAEKVVDPFIQRHLENPIEGRALEIGCGVGRVSRALAGRFKLVNAVDVSGEMIRQAQSLNNAIPNLFFFQTDGSSYPAIEDSSIDYVFSFTTFQHMPSEQVIESNLREISRVLKPGGCFQVDFSIPAGWHRFGIFALPRALKTYIPQIVAKSLRIWTISDPLKRSETFGGVILTKHRAARLISNAGLSCQFDDHPFSPLKMMVQGFKPENI